MGNIRRAITVLSLSSAALAGSLVTASASPAHLTGQGHGTWQVQPGNPDTGTQRTVTGRGHFSIGDAKIRGSVTSPGFIANGACGVSVRLKTATGSIGLVGQTKRTDSSYPTCIGPYRFRFHTVKASGDLTGQSFRGVGRFDLEYASADATDHGGFTLKLSKLTATAATAPAPLTGHGRGTFTVKPANPDVGTTRIVHGRGHFSIGEAKIRGTVTAPGFVIEGSCGVSVRLVTDSGTIRVVGHSKVQSRSSGTICDGHSFRFHWRTAKATGDLAGMSFTGIGSVQLKDTSNSDYEHGTFAVKLSKLAA